MTITEPLQLEGNLLVKGTPDYEEARCRNFATNSHRRRINDGDDKVKEFFPAFIAVCQSITDVQKCIKFARAQPLTITIRTGGHNWFGCFLRDNVFLIDMSAFKHMSIDSSSKLATVGPAVLGNELNEAAAKEGLCFTSGHCLGVPLGGYLLGGGFGWFQQYYGYAAEHITEITLVDSNGDIVKATDGDWMWMARGSASAFPGVLVECQIRLSPLPAIVRAKTDFFAMEAYPSIVSFLNEYAANQYDKKLELSVTQASCPPALRAVAKVDKLFIVSQTWMADSEEGFAKQVAPLTADQFPVPPIVRGEFKDRSFAGLAEMLGPVYPPGYQWIGRAILYESKCFAEMDWKKIQTTFEEKAPVGYSHCLLMWLPPRPVAKPGCYGSHSGKGFELLVVGVHNDDIEGGKKEAAATQDYVDSMMNLIEEHAWKYNPLEHPLNKHTFEKSFQESTKMRQIRSRLDPGHVFFDPTTSEQNH